MERSKLIRIHIDDDKRQVVNVVTWEQRKFSDVVEIGSGMDYKHLGEGDIPVYGTGGYMLSVDSALSEEKDAIGIGRKGTIDKPYILRAPFWTVDTLFYCIPKENHDLDFINCLFQTVDWKKKDESTGVPSLSKVIINNVEAVVPSFDEQKKIGEYFNNLDHLITLHQRKCDEMKKMKKFMLQKMFPKNGQKNPEIRFDGFTDDWEQRKLGEVVEKVTTKNNDTQYIETFTNSAELGIMSQRDYFDHDVSNIENISGYYIVENDAFVYNPRISTSAPVGPINRNKLGRTGVMSPLYTVFKVNGIDSEYLEWYFKSTGWHSFMKFNGDSGARSDRFSIKDSVFFEMPIPTPDIDEQEKIGEYFSSLDHLITLHQRKVENLKNLKKYMLQNMFV